MGMRLNGRTVSLLFGVASFILPYVVLANPSSPTVVHGDVHFSEPSLGELQIQAGDRAIINWGNFSIAKGELTRFIQPSKHSAVLNRVIGMDRSLIEGILEASGRVYLVNRNGVIVKPGAVINAASFFASTLDVLDQAFKQGKELPFFGGSQEEVVNEGLIKAWDGHIVLLGRKVENRGKLEALGGQVEMIAAAEAIYVPDEKEGFCIRVGQFGEDEQSSILNTGDIQALQATLKTQGNPYGMAIQHSGRIEANGILEQDGQVYLIAHQGTVDVQGEICAPSGTVKMVGEYVRLENGSSVDVSGASQGGTALIGGGLQGEPIEGIVSKQTFVDPLAAIRAQAEENGDGGNVVVWADGATWFYGHIDARGGRNGGDGGFVEVSGKSYLDFQGVADRSAPYGISGTLLLDPINLTLGAVSASVFAPPPPRISFNVSDRHWRDSCRCRPGHSIGFRTCYY